CYNISKKQRRNFFTEKNINSKIFLHPISKTIAIFSSEFFTHFQTKFAKNLTSFWLYQGLNNSSIIYILIVSISIYMSAMG
ncbi:MAG: hypothetical protein IJE92_02865, partial [Clostridia bacterium]|nr:hypothetical protein [Clostridia bacterium]